MQQRLVVWGEIGTDHKALIAIELVEERSMVIFRAFPQEMANNDLQYQLFTVWKNGGEYDFPAELPVWEIDATQDNLLPPEIKLEKPSMLINAQNLWNKKVMSAQKLQLVTDKLDLLAHRLEGLKDFDQGLWDEAKQVWDEVMKLRKKGLITWLQADEIKPVVNKLFDGLKAFRRIHHEHNIEESTALNTLFTKRVEELTAKLIYPKEWNKIFNSLRNIQKEVNAAPMVFKHKREIHNMLNRAFNDLRNYRKADHIQHLEERIRGLEKVIDGLVRSAAKDDEDYEAQVEKMRHYTRGKMSDDEIRAQFRDLKDRSKNKLKKIRSVEKTLAELRQKIEKASAPEEEKEKPAKQKKKKAGKKKSTAPAAEAVELENAEDPATEQENTELEIPASESDTDTETGEVTEMEVQEGPIAEDGTTPEEASEEEVSTEAVEESDTETETGEITEEEVQEGPIAEAGATPEEASEEEGSGETVEVEQAGNAESVEEHSEEIVSETAEEEQQPGEEESKA